MAIAKPILNGCFLVVFSAILPSFLFAASTPLPKGDVYLGFTRTGNDVFYPNVGALNGWDAAVQIKVHKPFLGVEGDVSHFGIGANSTVPRTTTFLAGPRLTVKVLGPRVFVHALVGGKHSANRGGPTAVSANGFAYMLGGGLDVPIFPFFAWRIAGDYTGVPARGGTPARFSTGLVFRF